MLDYNEEVKGSFDLTCESSQQQIMEIVANFHYRDGVKYKDGSYGTIKITNKEFNDCLAYLLGVGLNDH